MILMIWRQTGCSL